VSDRPVLLAYVIVAAGFVAATVVYATGAVDGAGLFVLSGVFLLGAIVFHVTHERRPELAATVLIVLGLSAAVGAMIRLFDLAESDSPAAANVVLLAVGVPIYLIGFSFRERLRDNSRDRP